ncbi:MAG: DMT family transporter [Pseudomonadota bacterium]
MSLSASLPSKTHSHLGAILVAFAGVGFLSLMDAFMKEAALAAGAYTATLLRSVVATVIIAPVWASRRPKWPHADVMKLHLERGVISALMALSFFFALTKLPLAEAIALSFIAPLIALYLARILLGEEIQRAAILASILGFAGTIVIVGGRIGAGEFDPDAALGMAALLFSALLYAYNFIVIRRQSQRAGPIEIATFHSGIGGFVLLMFAPFLWVTPDLSVTTDIAAAGLLTVLGAMAIAWAYARAEAQTLVPIEYSGFVWASVFGWLFFQEGVTLTTLAGTALIVTGCLIATRASSKAQAELQGAEQA